jgi:iron complex transport system ATP-binding protein
MRLSARDIIVRAGSTELLRSVSIDAAPGEVLGLIGPNGAGKSTLMRVMAGVKTADQGTVLYDGRTAAQMGRRVLARRLAFLPQGGGSAWPLSVERLVALGRVPHRGPFGAPDLPGAQAIEQSLAVTDLIDLRQRAVTTLSGGELARTLLARALAVGGDALLADEPVAALDPCHQLEVMAILRQRADAGGTVAVVLHDLALAARFCDRLVLLHQGRIAAQGTPDEVLSDALLAQVYRVRALRLQPPGDGAAAVLPWQLLPSTHALQEPHP